MFSGALNTKMRVKTCIKGGTTPKIREKTPVNSVFRLFLLFFKFRHPICFWGADYKNGGQILQQG